MYKINLKNWVLLLTVVPIILIGSVLAGYFSYLHSKQLSRYIDQQTRAIIQPIAVTGAVLLQQRERGQLRALINDIHRRHSDLIRSIAIFTQDNQLFVTSTYQAEASALRLKPSEQLPDSIIISSDAEFTIYRTPIIISADNAEQSMLTLPTNNNEIVIGYVAIKIDATTTQYLLQKQIFSAFIIVLIGVGISAIFAFMLVRNVTEPISSMVKAIDRIREGKLESRVTGQLVGELNLLKNGINAMAQSLGDFRDEMQEAINQKTHDIEQTLEEYEVQNLQLAEANRKAQEANKVKSEFLANMSHELRTPLNGVLGFTRQTLKTQLNDVQRDYLQTIERSANNLLVLINDILDFSKLDAGKMVIENIPFSLRDNIEEAVILLAPSAHNKNLELSLRISDQVPDSLIGDAMRIKQILINLTNNAIKFTHQGSVTIDIDCEYLDSSSAVIKVIVTDTGIGMTANQQDTIFDAFSQADKSVTRLYGGTGLGLVISQRLAQEMKGNIGFTSEANKGSQFWFTVQCELNPIPMLTTTLDITDFINKSILFFEQHNHSRLATIEILTNWHMKVTPVTHIEQLTELLEKSPHYDYALIGHSVSPLALEQLKQIITVLKPHCDSIHVAINSNAPFMQESIISAGAISCISKPITTARLHKALLEQTTKAPLPHHPENNKKLPVKVLAVDDNEANLKLIKALLTEHVTDITTATHGQEAVDLCQQEKFAIIFMDIQMPVMDGVSAMNKIRAGTLNDQTPIIAVTAHALTEEKEKLLTAGFDGCVTKPIDEALLRHSLYEYCGLSQVNFEPQNTGINAIHPRESKSIPERQTITYYSQKISEQVFDYHLALTRAAQNNELAREMFSGLIASLPETKLSLENAINSQDIMLAKTLIHKLNGACCYTGVPNLANITNTLETELKKGLSIDELQPEWFEFFEHVETLLKHAEQITQQFDT
jgi:two-component system sensor histidine kinase BarA